MLIKLIGIIIIFVSSSLLGIYFSYKPFYRKSEIEKFNLALEILENEIQNNSSFIEASNVIKEKINDSIVSNIFSEFKDRLIQKDGEEINLIWNDIINSNKKQFYMTDEDIEKIKEIGCIFNCFEMDIQIKNLNILKKYLQVKIDEINAEFLKSKKMLQSLGILGGLMIIIVLI